MSNLDVIRAWKDEQYRLSLSSEEQALLPANPAGGIELTDDLLDQVAGGEELPTAAGLLSGCCTTMSALENCSLVFCGISLSTTSCL